MTGLRASLASIAALLALCLGGAAEAHGRAAQEWRGAEAPAVHNDVLAEASRWIGRGNITGKRGPWCGWFASLVLTRTGHRALPSGLASSALSYGRRVRDPRPGDLAVMSHHVGFVAGVEPDGSILIISGNWNNRVARAVVPRAVVVAFVRPV